jgi:hypothetical protein
MRKVSITHWFMERAAVVADVTLCGSELDTQTEEPKFDEIEFQTGGLAELSGHIPLAVTIPLGDAPKVYTVKWRDEAEQRWKRGDDDVILSFDGRLRPAELYSFSISTSPMVRVRGPARSLDDWVESYVNPVRGIASITTTIAQPINFLTVGATVVDSLPGRAQTPRTVRAQVFMEDVSQQPYVAQRSDIPAPPLFSVAETNVPLSSLIDHWQMIGQEYDVFLQLYAASLSREMSPRAKLLTLAPALESLHGQKHGTGKHSVGEHKDRRKGVLKRVRELKLCSDDYRFISRWLDGRGAYTLPERLRALYESIDQATRATIASKISPIPQELAAIHPNPRDIWDVVGRLRNDLAHGGPAHKDAEIASTVRLCQTIATGLILTELGVPTTSMREAIDRGDWRPI